MCMPSCMWPQLDVRSPGGRVSVMSCLAWHGCSELNFSLSWVRLELLAGELSVLLSHEVGIFKSAAQLADYLCSPCKLGVIVCICNPNHSGGWECHAQLYRGRETSLCYIRPCFKKKRFSLHWACEVVVMTDTLNEGEKNTIFENNTFLPVWHDLR